MFEKIAIGIKTFLRDDCLYNTIEAIRTNLPDAQMIIADCGDHTEEKEGVYADLAREGHHTIQLPFDAGFGAMSNAIASALTRPYLLMGSDDFDFSPRKVRDDVQRLEWILEKDRSVSIASGRVNDCPYEFTLIESYHYGEIREIPVNCSSAGHGYGDYLYVDLTVNYSLIRNKVLDVVRWDDDVRIGGGEHGAFFVDCQRAGFKTIYVPGVNINEQQVRNSARYNEYRNRARSPERPCFVRRGIKKYILGDGRIDYEEKQ